LGAGSGHRGKFQSMLGKLSGTTWKSGERGEDRQGEKKVKPREFEIGQNDYQPGGKEEQREGREYAGVIAGIEGTGADVPTRWRGQG